VPSHAALALCLGFAFLERRKLPFFPTKLVERDQARALSTRWTTVLSSKVNCRALCGEIWPRPLPQIGRKVPFFPRKLVERDQARALFLLFFSITLEPRIE
jgi:hypothetical protein